MKPSRAQARRRVLGLKTAAMIDVVFLLLVFFVLAARFRVPEGELDTHMPPGGPFPAVDEVRIVLRVPPSGQEDPGVPPAVFLDGVAVAAQPGRTSMAVLESRLDRLSGDAALREGAPVVIEAEPALAYRWPVKTLNMCRKFGFRRVSFAASRRSGRPAENAHAEQPR